jgi:hypothetical protein
MRPTGLAFSSPPHKRRELAEAPGAFAEAPGGVLFVMGVDFGGDEVFLMAAALDEDLAVRVHDVAVAVADAGIAGDAGFGGIEDDVVAADEIDAVFVGAGGVVGADFHEVGDEALVADVVEVRGEDDARAFEREDARGLDVAAVGADEDAEFEPVDLPDGEVAALLVKLHVGGAFAVEAELLAVVGDDDGVVEVAAAQLIEPGDGHGGVAGGDVENAQHLRRIGGEGAFACEFLGVGIAGEEALGEGDDLRALGVGPFEAFFKAGEVVLEVADPRLELAVRDFHAGLTALNA